MIRGTPYDGEGRIPAFSIGGGAEIRGYNVNGQMSALRGLVSLGIDSDVAHISSVRHSKVPVKVGDSV